jgi:Na+/H+-translocating membrane pyrophosphatase
VLVALASQDVSNACRTGAATNIIFGLALGYKSCIIPTIVIGEPPQRAPRFI